MMRVVLIVPPKYYHRFWDIRHFTYPIGIWSIASTLDNQLGVSVRILDCIAEDPTNIEDVNDNTMKMGLSNEHLIKKVCEYEPDIIGMQCVSSNQHPALLYYSELLKMSFPTVPIVAGGAHVSALPERVLLDAKGSIDYVVIGEGEITALELLKNVTNPNTIQNIKGLAIWNKGDIVINERRELVSDLDSLALLDPKFFREINYPDTPPHSYFTFVRRWTEVMFSRGCPFSCDWCFSPEMWQGKFRKIGLNRVRQQLELLWQEGYRELLVEDDNLFLDQPWGTLIIKLIKELGFYWQIAGGLHLEQLSMELVDEVAENNCTTVYLPINVIRKIGEQNVDLLLNKKYVEIFKRFKGNGIYVFSSIILGIPDQSVDNMKSQIEYAHNLVSNDWVDYCVIFAFSPLPGTAWWQKVIQRNGYKFPCKDIKWEQFSNHVPCEILTPYWKFDELETLVLKAHELINGTDKTEAWFKTKQWVRC